jgi:hypothetical protein
MLYYCTNIRLKCSAEASLVPGIYGNLNKIIYIRIIFLQNNTLFYFMIDGILN